MGRLAIVQNSPHQGPGLVAEILAERRIDFDLAWLDKGESFPRPDDYEAIIGLGGGDANDSSETMQSEMSGMRAAMAEGVPQLHICFAAQLLVRVAGGEVVQAKRKEVGFVDPEGHEYIVSPNHPGRDDPLFSGMPHAGFNAFQLHGDRMRVHPATGLTPLAWGNDLNPQVVRIGSKAYGVQFHPEVTPDLLEDWCCAYPDFIDDEKRIWADFSAKYNAARPIGERLIGNFLDIAGLTKS